MIRKISQALADWLESGGEEIGEIAIRREKSGFFLRHRDDLTRSDLESHSGAVAARHLATYDDVGKFRPLKTAPNLRHGWELFLPDLEALRQALDFFYPAMLGVWLSHTRGELAAVPLRQTLGRQSGMYRVTQKISDEQAQRLIGGFCRSDGGCLKHLLWPLAPEQPVLSLPPEKLRAPAAGKTLPLLCHEACNLLVAKAREVVKKTGSSA
ncbi:MAG TPA: DR2241 family protein [Chthoniobacteraceae bacterium]